jgi:hypothetical protein
MHWAGRGERQSLNGRHGNGQDELERKEGTALFSHSNYHDIMY